MEMEKKSPISLLLFLILFSSIDPSSTSQQASITFRPKTLNRSGDPVVIQWSGVTNPSPLDWLGIYSPPESRNHHFLGYIFLNSSENDHLAGSGEVTVPLPILRQPYQFRIFRWNESEVDPTHLDHDHNPIPVSKRLLVSSAELGFEPRRGPEQVHLALTGGVGEMRVLFLTEDGEGRFVRYGEEEAGLWHVVEAGRAVTYARDDMCGSPANGSLGWRDPGWIHDAVMRDLKNGSRYYYQVGSESKGWSTTRSFVSKNEDSDETYAFLFGDMGTSTPYSTFHRTQEESISTMKWILRDIEALGDKPALVSHIGDISYARGFGWIWDHFFTQIEPVASKVPYHVCIGNHEYNWPSQPWRPEWSYGSYGKDGGGECGVPYSLKFNMPGNSSEPTGTRAPATRNLYYSFDMGAVHFVYISTETNFLPGSSQYDFLKHDLGSVNRKKTPFVVVQGHRPMYTTSHENRDVPLMNKMLEHLEPLLVKNNVTLALWGHVHRYERFCPMKNYTCGSTAQNGEPVQALPVHVVIGMAGQAWQPIWEPRPTHPDDPVFPQPVRSMYRGGEFGYTRLVATKEKLTFSYVGNHDGQVHDTVEFLASGQVLNGDAGAASGPVAKVGNMQASIFPRYVTGGGLLVLGALIGYFSGFMTHSRKKNWTPVKTEDI